MAATADAASSAAVRASRASGCAVVFVIPSSSPGRVSAGLEDSRQNAAVSRLPTNRNWRGIVHPRAGQAVFDVAQHRPSAALAPFASYLWTVEWDLSPGRRHVQR